jgi:hypothetical protein
MRRGCVSASVRITTVTKTCFRFDFDFTCTRAQIQIQIQIQNILVTRTWLALALCTIVRCTHAVDGVSDAHDESLIPSTPPVCSSTRGRTPPSKTIYGHIKSNQIKCTPKSSTGDDDAVAGVAACGPCRIDIADGVNTEWHYSSEVLQSKFCKRLGRVVFESPQRARSAP